MRRLYHLYAEADARQEVMEALSVILEATKAVDILFEDRKCTACGERGDPRIMSRFEMLFIGK